MTHIIIPKEQWQTFLKAREMEDIDHKTLNGYLERVINEVKEISLGEKDIEEKVKEATNKHDLNGWEQIGYRKALKDLS